MSSLQSSPSRPRFRPCVRPMHLIYPRGLQIAEYVSLEDEGATAAIFGGSGVFVEEGSKIEAVKGVAALGLIQGSVMEDGAPTADLKDGTTKGAAESVMVDVMDDATKDPKDGATKGAAEIGATDGFKV